MMLTVSMFRDQKSNHEIHENIVPRRVGAIGSAQAFGFAHLWSSRRFIP